MLEPPQEVPRFMYPAWFSCLMWSIGNTECVQAFTRQTGIPAPSCRGGIESMIDKATGLEEKFVHAYAEWFHKTIWGDMSSEEEAKP